MHGARLVAHRALQPIAFLLVAVAFFLPSAAHATTVFLTSGTSWTVPSDWHSSNNTIEVIGGGAGGGGGNGVGGAGGGGAGAYSKVSNVSLTPSGSVTYAVGAAGAAGGFNSSGGNGGDTYFCNSTSNCASISGTAVVVGAKRGSGGADQTDGAGGAGGSSASGVGSTKSNGGNGFSITGGGGGGAAGSHGDGNQGNTGTGGTGDAGSGGGAGGGAGTEWDASHGSGGGGDSCAGAGGNYGGGGAGTASCGNTGGSGKAGIIVITYTPPRILTLTGGVKFLGSLSITGALSKGSGTFVIDDPLSPRTKLLYHSFVESPDVKNIYNGIATLDKDGEVTIVLPTYWDALNKDPRYQFFPLYHAMPNLYIKEEEHDNRFAIAGGVPGGQVSWQITGIRHDAYILANPIIVEVLKTGATPVKKSECLWPPLCQ
jgi:glycine rich protein